MQDENYIRNGVVMVRVNKYVARKVFNFGKKVYLIQDMMRLSNAWESPCPISKESERTFDALVNEYRYYNCDNERGRGVKYFVAESDVKCYK